MCPGNLPSLVPGSESATDCRARDLLPNIFDQLPMLFLFFLASSLLAFVGVIVTYVPSFMSSLDLEDSISGVMFSMLPLAAPLTDEVYAEHEANISC